MIANAQMASTMHDLLLEVADDDEQAALGDVARVVQHRGPLRLELGVGPRPDHGHVGRVDDHGRDGESRELEDELPEGRALELHVGPESPSAIERPVIDDVPRSTPITLSPRAL